MSWPDRDRAFVEFLMLAGETGLDALTVACELTLECGVISAPIVMNELRRLITSHLPAAVINVPDGIALTVEPIAIVIVMIICWGSPISIEHATSLKALQLYGMPTAWGELQAEKPKQTHRPESWMERLIAAEQTDRQLKSLRYQLKAATSRFIVIRWALTGLKRRCRKWL